MRKRILAVIKDLRAITNVEALDRSWELSYLPNSAAAVNGLTRSDVEAVVSDLPNEPMGGEPSLFDQITQRFPTVTRIMLCEAGQKAPLRSDGSAHQYLMKPLSTDVLISAVERARLVRNWMLEPAIKNLFARMKKLPSVPAVYLRLMKKLQSPETSLDEIGDVVSEDLNLTVKVLQIVNSAAFGLNRTVTTPQDAVSYLGIERTKGLVLVASAFAQSEGKESGTLSVDELWRHSVTTAKVARSIARHQRGTKFAESAFTGGLLHDIGKLLFAVNMPEEYKATVQRARDQALPLEEVETETLGASHAQIGACVLAIWGLPSDIVNAIAFHHQPEKFEEKGFTTLTAVHAANALAQEAEQNNPAILQQKLDSQYLRNIGVMSHLDAWRGAIATGQ